jgi:hypothetical protein
VPIYRENSVALYNGRHALYKESASCIKETPTWRRAAASGTLDALGLSIPHATLRSVAISWDSMDRVARLELGGISRDSGCELELPSS